jgi:steroid delta-isomerase
MTPAEAQHFTEEWIANWNRKDVAAIVAHFAPHARFTSPRALEVTGSAVVEGVEALTAYWQRASASASELHFTLDYALFDEKRQELCVVYDARRNGVTRRACELMRFDSAGRQIAGEALYGAPV